MYTSNTSNIFSDVDHRKTTAHLNQGKNMALTGRDVRVYFFKSSGWSADTILTKADANISFDRLKVEKW